MQFQSRESHSRADDSGKRNSECVCVSREIQLNRERNFEVEPGRVSEADDKIEIATGVLRRRLLPISRTLPRETRKLSRSLYTNAELVQSPQLCERFGVFPIFASVTERAWLNIALSTSNGLGRRGGGGVFAVDLGHPRFPFRRLTTIDRLIGDSVPEIQKRRGLFRTSVDEITDG